MIPERSIPMFPVKWAAMNTPGEKFQPSNGTGGDIFFDNWCRQCARDKAMNSGADYDECDDNEVCGIIAKTFAYKPEDPEYPTEWQYDKHGQPCCTAFVEIGQPMPEPRCTQTMDMFGEPDKD